MPITQGLTTTNVRLANTALATTFFPRVMKSVWPRICGLTKSSSIYEAFAFLGAPPLLKLWSGTIQSQGIQSYSVNVPNPVWKNYESFRRDQIEFDQTRTLQNRAAWHGTKLAQTWDYLLAQVMMNGTQAGSQNFLNPQNGTSYTMTFDNQPWFSASHTVANVQGATTFSNIITGNMPTTKAAILAQDITVIANYFQRDMEQIIDQFTSWTDDKGSKIYPNIDPEREIVVVVPPILSAAANLAFTTNGTLGGTSGSASGSVTNIGKRLVKDVITFGLLQGCTDITSQIPGTSVSPQQATQYYVFLDGDFVKPVYFQRFTPLKNTIPAGYDPDAETNKILNAANESGLKLNPSMAALYATAEVNSNLDQLGNNSSAMTSVDETFFFSSRTRGMIYPGPWFCSCLVAPTGTSN